MQLKVRHRNRWLQRRSCNDARLQVSISISTFLCDNFEIQFSAIEQDKKCKKSTETKSHLFYCLSIICVNCIYVNSKFSNCFGRESMAYTVIINGNLYMNMGFWRNYYLKKTTPSKETHYNLQFYSLFERTLQL